jgi:hypothetical protein
MQSVTFPATVTKMTTKVDRSIKVELVTQELAPADGNILFGFTGNLTQIAMAYDPEALVNIEPPKEDVESSGKSPSQRLHSVLFVLFNQKPEGFTSFPLFYQHKMEKVINHFKNQLAD